MNEFTDQQPALRPEVLTEARDRLIALGSFHGNKLLVEEDKGALLGAAVALTIGLPLAVARWYPYQLPTGSSQSPPIEVEIDSEYFTGRLFVNGIGRGDRVTVVDDTLSTGGTLDALLRAVRQAGAFVEEVLVVVEKAANGGRDRILREHGVEVRSVLRIDVDPVAMRSYVVDAVADPTAGLLGEPAVASIDGGTPVALRQETVVESR